MNRIITCNRQLVKVAVLIFLSIMTYESVYAQGTLGKHEHEQHILIAPPRKLKQDGKQESSSKPTLLVEGNNKYAQFTMEPDGGYKNLSISTNQGVPSVNSLPSWINLKDKSNSSLSLYCEPNMTPSQREADFYITAGDLKVRVHVKQASGRITIKKCEFINTDDYSETINGPAERMPASKIQYLNPVLTYDGPGKTQEKTIYVKIYNPHGKLITAPNAPEGYSYKDKVSFFRGKDQTITLMGFGRPNQNIYGVGTVRVDVYMDGEHVASGSVELY